MKILIGSSIWRAEDIEHSLAMRELVHHFDKNNINYIDIAQVGDALIARSRNHVAKYFLESDCDVLWITDGDMVFEAPDILRICRTVSKDKGQKYAIVGGAYVTRQPPHRPALRLPEGVVVRFSRDNHELVEVDYLATGCLAIHRKVFEKLRTDMVESHGMAYSTGPDDYWPFFSTFLNEVRENWHEELSEDYAFAKRAKDAGFTSWLDPSIRLGHVGTYVFTLEDSDRPAKVAADVIAYLREGDDIRVMRARP